MDRHLESTLLCECLGTRTDEGETTKLDQLSSSDWDRLIDQALRHSVAPLLYYHLKTRSSSTRIPAGILQRLQTTYLTSAARNIRLYHELSNILTLLQNEGIPVIVLKGAHLAEIVYGNIALRSMCDIDLLLKKSDLARSQQKLMNAGYSPDNDDLHLDLHWNIENSIADLHVNMEEVWQRSQSAIIAGVRVLVLSPEDLLVHLCLHLAFHHLFQFAGLRPLYDIREAITYYAPQMKWEQIRKIAEQWDIRNSVFLTLSLAKDLVGAQIPESVIEDLKGERFDPQVKAWAIEQIFHETGNVPSLSPYFWQLWKADGSFREKVVVLRRLLFPPPEFISQKYPVSFKSIQNYLYYVVRLKNHFIPYITAIWRILSREQEMIRLIKQQNHNIEMREWLESR